MSDRVRDRTIVLRVLPKELQQKLRSKMAAAKVGSTANENVVGGGRGSNHYNHRYDNYYHRNTSSTGEGGGGNGSNSNGSSIVDLDGVEINPPVEGGTLYSFTMDGKSYPARLYNLPCPVEIHKTHDHAMFYKCTDIGQILVVYGSMTLMDASEKTQSYRTEGFPSYYSSGVTPPMKNVVQRRFVQREHRAVPPPRADVVQVEQELQNLILTLSKDGGKSTTSASGTNIDENKIVEEIDEEVVDYEPYMDDFGRQPKGIIVDEKDRIITTRPEVWLPPNTRETIEHEKENTIRKEAQEAAAATVAAKKAKEEEAAAAAAAMQVAETGTTETTTGAEAESSTTGGSKKKSKKGGSNKTDKKGKNKKGKKGKKNLSSSTTEPTGPTPKKGIASRKSREAAAKAAAEAQAAEIVAAATTATATADVVPVSTDGLPAVDTSIDEAALMIAQGGAEDDDLLGLNDGFFDFSAEGEDGFGDFGL